MDERIKEKIKLKLIYFYAYIKVLLRVFDGKEIFIVNSWY